MSRNSEPNPSGGATEHIGVDIPADVAPNQPAVRSDGKKTRAERNGLSAKAGKPRLNLRKFSPWQTARTVLMTCLATGLAYFAVNQPRTLVFIVPLFLLGILSLVANYKRRKGKARLVVGLVPRLGFRGKIWRLIGADFYAIFGWSWLKALSWRDREQQSLEILWDLRFTQKILAFGNSKGSSGKTPVCTWLACMLAWAIKQPPLALDINENPNHTATWLGIDPSSTLQLRAFLRSCLTGTLETASKLLSQVQWHRQTGTKVISAEATSLEAFTPEQVIAGIKVAKMHNHSVFCDLGNGIIASGNWGAVAMADTLVVCGNVNTANSEQDVASTMHRYTELGHEQQVEHSIIVIVGAKPDQREVYAKRYDHPLEQVHVIPFNRYMARGNPVDIYKIPLRIRVILLEILVAVMRAPSVAKGFIDRSKIQELTIEAPSVVAQAPSGATAATAKSQ